MKKYSKYFIVCLMVVGLVFASTAFVTAATIPIGTVDGDWANAVGGQNVLIQNDQAPDERLASIEWGGNDGRRSSYDFLTIATPFFVETDGTPFALGDFTHNNFPIQINVSITSVQLMIDIGIGGIAPILAVFDFMHNETPNNPADGVCVYGGEVPCPDVVTLVNPVVNRNFVYDGENYYFNLIGFSEDGGATQFTEWLTLENQSNVATLYAQITERPVGVPEPLSLILLGFGLVGVAGVRRKLKG